MKNKILIVVTVPALNEKYDLFIPTNEKVSTTIKLITKILVETEGVDPNSLQGMTILNQSNTVQYDAKMLVRDTDIKNATKLIMI